MNLATRVTVFRILFTPVFVFAVLQSHPQESFWLWVTLVLAIFSEVTDGLDGWMARRMNQVSSLGKLLDPLADSLARMSAFIAFGIVGWINPWAVLIFVWRDIIVASVRTAAASQGIVLAARSSGKIKAIGQAAAIFAVILCQLFEVYSVAPSIPWIPIQTGFVLTAAFITAWSCIDYAISCRAALRALARR